MNALDQNSSEPFLRKDFSKILEHRLTIKLFTEMTHLWSNVEFKLTTN